MLNFLPCLEEIFYLILSSESPFCPCWEELWRLQRLRCDRNGWWNCSCAHWDWDCVYHPALQQVRTAANCELANVPSSPFSFYFSPPPPPFSPLPLLLFPSLLPPFSPLPPTFFFLFFHFPLFSSFCLLIPPFFPFPPLFPPFPSWNPLILVPEHPLQQAEQEMFGCFPQEQLQLCRKAVPCWRLMGLATLLLETH